MSVARASTVRRERGRTLALGEAPAGKGASGRWGVGVPLPSRRSALLRPLTSSFLEATGTRAVEPAESALPGPLPGNPFGIPTDPAAPTAPTTTRSPLTSGYSSAPPPGPAAPTALPGRYDVGSVSHSPSNVHLRRWVACRILAAIEAGLIVRELLRNKVETISADAPYLKSL